MDWQGDHTDRAHNLMRRLHASAYPLAYLFAVPTHESNEVQCKLQYPLNGSKSKQWRTLASHHKVRADFSAKLRNDVRFADLPEAFSSGGIGPGLL